MSEILWNIYASGYDAIALLIPYQNMMARVVDAAGLRPGMKILDAGCGTGNLLVEIFNRNVPVEVIAVDTSMAMLRRAQRKVDTHSVEFQRVDLSQPLPYQKGTFDVIFCINVLYSIRNIQSTLDEFNRILRSGGKLVIVDPRETAQFMRIFWNHFSGFRLPEIFKRLVIFRPDLLVQLILSGTMNLWIDKKYHQGDWAYRSNSQWQQLLSNFENPIISPIYANQHWLITACKGACP